MLAEIGKLEAAAKSSLAKVEEELADFTGACLFEGRAEMKRQLELAMEERGQSANRTGIPQSTRPQTNSKSGVGVCEICREDIAIFDVDKICVPLTAADFKGMPRHGYPPFPPAATNFEFFHCPICRRRPWSEHNLILTNMGYFCVPEKKEEFKNG